MAASTSLTPEQRKARARKAHLAGAVRAVISRWSELSEAQRNAIRAIAA